MGWKVPEPIANPPELPRDLQLYLDAFLSLKNRDGAIPWEIIELYCDRHGFDDIQRDETHYHLLMLTEAHQKFWEEKGDG